MYYVCICEQVVRTLLYRTWLFLFGSSVPSCLAHSEPERSRLVAAVSEERNQLWDGLDQSQLLSKDRLVVRDPTECLHKHEMVCNTALCITRILPLSLTQHRPIPSLPYPI